MSFSAAVRRPLSVPATTLLAALVLAAAGCGGDDDEPETERKPAPQSVVSQVSQVPRLGNAPGATVEPQGPEVLNKLPPAPKPRSRFTPRINGVQGVPLPQALDTVGNDVAAFWLQEFNAAGLQFRPAKQAIVITPVQSECGPDGQPSTVETGPGAGPFYCSADETIFLTVGDFEQWIAPIGDAGTAIAVAHEWGHRIEDLLNMFRDPRYQSGPWLELTADCLAGVWMSSVFQRRALDAGDVEEALTLLSRIGDDPNVPNEDPHGTSEQRMAAFNQGYADGRAGDCSTINAAS